MGNVIQHQSERWDMNISLEDLLRANKECMVDRNYKAHKYDDCFHGYCMYLKHPQNTEYETMIGIFEDGFTYLGDGLPTKNFPMENTLEVGKEMILYRDWIMQKEKNKSKLLSKGIGYDFLDL
ncbi:MAG: hypothetical protein E7211_08645 [Clostridium lundense]|nr:hypothetical protein [Clostridium lundense]